MFQTILWAIVALILIVKFYRYSTYKPEGFPPGPPRIPIVGSYLFLFLLDYKYTHKAVVKLCEYYKSKVIGFYFGDSPIVVANDYESVREILYRSEFDGRPDFLAARLREPDFNVRGIFFTDGPFWKGQRRFALRHLRDFGFGRRDYNYEEEVQDEIQKLVNMIKEGPKYDHEKKFMKDGLCLFPNILMPALSNCFLQTLCGERVPRQEQYKNLKAGLGTKDFQLIVNEYGRLMTVMPWISRVFPNSSGYKALREGSMALYDFMKEIIVKNYKTFEEGRVRSFLDMYFQEIKEAEATGENTGFMLDQLCLICVDFLFPSITALQFQLSFLFKHLLYRPDVVKKIQAEIDEVVGRGRLPELNDRTSLSYSEATLREILRFETLVPSNLAHRALEDTKLVGYDIPKDTLLFASLYSFHKEERIWKDPENFRPERFLDEEGKLCLKKDLSLPFGAGKRLCAGETFARNTMFLGLTAIIQNFNFKYPGEKLPDLSDTRCGLVIAPEDYWLKLEVR